MDKPPDVRDILSLAHGLRLQKGGVVGRLCYVAIALLVVGTVVIWSIPGDQRIWVLLGLALVESFIITLIYRYGTKHPEIAILEGAEIIRREELILAAKDPKILIGLDEDKDVLSDPNPAQPKLISSTTQKNDQGGV